MQSHRKYLMVLTVIAITTVITMASLRNQNQNDLSHKQQKIPKVDESGWPIVTYESPEQVGEKQRARRQAKSDRHNRSFFGVKGAVKSAPHEGYTVILTEDWEVDVSPLPAAQSNVVVVGTVVDAQGFLSTDQTGVYSEFSTRIDEVLKTDGAAPLNSGDVIITQRRGGRVQGPSARILFRIRGQNMPRRGGEYVMFLQRLDEGEDYKIITGYELRDGKVLPLDSVDKFALYAGWDEATFLQALRKVMVQP